METGKYPIIARGELYVDPIRKPTGGGPKKYTQDYGEARQNLIDGIDHVFNAVDNSRELFLDTKIVCVRMEEKFEAKSYVPDQILVSNEMEIIGGRRYKLIDDTEDERVAKLYFVKSDTRSLEELRRTLTSGAKDEIESWRNNIMSIRSFDLLAPDEKIMGFSDEWKEGIVEIILHPLKHDQDKALTLFYSTSGISKENVRIKVYEDGLTFISAKCGYTELDKLKYLNPLRAAHPLGRITVPSIRNLSVSIAPQIDQSNKKSIIKVGVFDGGADSSNPLLEGYVESTDCVSTDLNAQYLSHGNSVCGIVLHGNLAGKGKDDVLPIPSVSVESFRVIPVEDGNDFELYEAIDAIEDTVKKRPDIKLYNLSFGPPGAIIDDSLNRFTYALDELTHNIPEEEVNPLFGIAVGNYGELQLPFNRIQSPADMVNGLGVGAYTYKPDGTKTRASYSCVGYGREGAKVKPDLLEFGGSNDRPFIIVGDKSGTLSSSFGTSFATPLIIHKIGKLMAKSKEITPHIGRALMIHHAFPDDSRREEIGFGYSKEDVDEILLCDDKEVTMLYSGKIRSSEVVHLPIFAPRINDVPGFVEINWTIATIVTPFANDPDAYTNHCIEDVFMPHSETFSYN